jgi:hypothetical protein
MRAIQIKGNGVLEYGSGGVMDLKSLLHYSIIPVLQSSGKWGVGVWEWNNGIVECWRPRSERAQEHRAAMTSKGFDD